MRRCDGEGKKVSFYVFQVDFSIAAIVEAEAHSVRCFHKRDDRNFRPKIKTQKQKELITKSRRAAPSFSKYFGQNDFSVFQHTAAVAIGIVVLVVAVKTCTDCM